MTSGTTRHEPPGTAPLLADEPVDLQLDVVASVLALRALGTGLAWLLNYRLIQDESATTASTVTYLLPIVAVILGAIILSEPITWNLFAGTAIVLAGVALSERRFAAAGPRLTRAREPEVRRAAALASKQQPHADTSSSGHLRWSSRGYCLPLLGGLRRSTLQ